MIKFIAARFTLTGLSPTIDIIDVENDTALISGAAMTELTSKSKVYVYQYTTYDPGKNLYFEVDGGAALSDNERYPTAVNTLNDVEAMEMGRWKIEGNQLLCYALDGSTVLFTFDLKDINGNLTSRNIFERIPV